MKKHNFNAGPSILPREVIEKTAQAILDYNGSGLSLMEISHRAKDFQPVVDEARALFKELLGIPDGYSVLFLGGGASLEFCMVPYNFLEHKAAYLNTGTWAKKALKEWRITGSPESSSITLSGTAPLMRDPLPPASSIAAFLGGRGAFDRFFLFIEYPNRKLSPVPLQADREPLKSGAPQPQNSPRTGLRRRGS